MACTVYQYLGEKFTGTGWEVYFTEPDNIDLENFDCSILQQAIGLTFDTFHLTELELLSCNNLNTWLSYCARPDAGQDTLGYKVFEELAGVDFVDFQQDTADLLNNLIANNPVNPSENFIQLDNPEVLAKLNIARGWLQDIYSKYYGQAYLVKVGDSNVGVCIKDRFGNVPSGNIKVESEGGLFYSSDAPSTAGAWLSKTQNNVLGLSIGRELYAFTESDGRIGTFVKFNNSINISKFGLVWDTDLSALGDDNFYRKDDALYVKASIDPAIYRIQGIQYVLVTLNGAGSLRISPSAFECKALVASVGAVSLLTLHGNDHLDALSVSACDDEEDEKNGTDLLKSNINNIFSMNAPAISPDRFCLPFRSNVFTYGPWFFQANPIGGTDIESNRELAPWNFSNLQNSGYDTMNYYGYSLATDGARGLQKQESGSITVASLPSYSIGYIVAGNAATLTDMQISIGDNGYTTTYNFQTYTPKFGRPGRHLNDLWKRNYKSMSYLHKFFKDENLKIRSLINKTEAEIQSEKYKQRKNLNTGSDVVSMSPAALEPNQPVGGDNQKTPNMFIFGGYRFRTKESNYSGGSDSYDNSSGALTSSCDPCYETPAPASGSLISSTITPGNKLINLPGCIMSDTLHNHWKKNNHFERLSIASMDLFFLPISTKQENDPYAELPRLAMYQDYGASFTEFANKSDTNLGDGKPPNSRTRLEIPPFLFDDTLQYDMPIHQMYLNSVTSAAMLSLWDGRLNGTVKGFVTHVIGYGDEAKNFTLSQLESAEDTKQNQTNFRYNALRGPLTLQSWGYDTSGKPIPNAIDSAEKTEKGQFRRFGLQDKFLKDWLSNPKTWPVGPIDLRWDRERGVWVAPPANKIVVAKLLTNLEKFGSAEAELIDPEADGLRFYEEYDIWSQNGANIKSSMYRTKIKVYDFLGIKLCKCDYIYAYYDDNRYIVLESNRAYKDPNASCCATTGTVSIPTQPTQPTPTLATNCWCDLECLKTLQNFKEGKHQALVHKQETNGPDCLVWEDIVECYTPPPNFYQN